MSHAYLIRHNSQPVYIILSCQWCSQPHQAHFLTFSLRSQSTTTTMAIQLNIAATAVFSNYSMNVRTCLSSNKSTLTHSALPPPLTVHTPSFSIPEFSTSRLFLISTTLPGFSIKFTTLIRSCGTLS